MTTPAINIKLPHKFTSREYQKAAMRSVGSSPNQKKHGVLVWHRRSGKDKTCLNLVIKEMVKRVGTYLYLFPTAKQAKKVIWLGMDRDGMKFLDHFPAELIAKKNEAELTITLKNGSVFMLGGTDRENRDAWMGSNPVGIVYSEYSLQNPSVRGYMRPILVENGGWELFEYTPRGGNHGLDMWDMAKNNPKWFAQLLTINDTCRPDGSPLVTQEMIDDEIEAGADADLTEQEYFCSFTAAMKGAYYGKEIELAEKEGRIQDLPFEPNLPVHTCWDIGMSGDSNDIWFFQVVGPWFHYINHYAMGGVGIQHYVKYLQGLQSELGYTYGTHYAPHDIQVRDWSGDGKTRKEIAADLGLDFIRVHKHSVEDRIDVTRAHISKCRFDKTKCADGVKGLKSYTKKYDEERKIFLVTPQKDWATHKADSFGIGVMGYEETKATQAYHSALSDYQGVGAWMG